MKKIIAFVLLFALLFTGCSSKTQSNADEKLTSLPCGEMIKKQLDALITGGDIGYGFEDVNGITPFDLGAYIRYRGAEMLGKAEGDFLSEEECLSVLKSDFGIDYIPFNFEESEEYKTYCAEEGHFKGRYSITEVKENGNEICVTADIEIPLLSMTELAFNEKANSFLHQKVKYVFETDSESSTIKAAEIIIE